jgi:hypothetical protein
MILLISASWVARIIRTSHQHWLIHSFKGNTSTIFFLTFFFYPPFLVCYLPLTWPFFYNIACICIGPIFRIWEKTCDLWLSEPG